MELINSITSDLRFQYIAFVLGVLYFGAFVWNLNHGGIIHAIMTVSLSIYGLAITIIFLSIVVVKVYHIVYPYRMFIE